MKIELPQLPYKLNALEPNISARTLEMHHRNHHQAYVAKLSNLIPGTRFENADLESIIREANGPIFYNAMQVWNHTFYFGGINCRKEYNLNGSFSEAISKSFGSMSEFREAIKSSVDSMFGCGWIWLTIDKNGDLKIIQQIESESPLRKGMKPILAIDVCEHAYNLDYGNRRGDYINSFWDLINWDVIEKRFYNCYSANRLNTYSETFIDTKTTKEDFYHKYDLLVMQNSNHSRLGRRVTAR